MRDTREMGAGLMDTQASIEATVSSVASKGMGGGSVASIIGWMSSNEGIALMGIIITILGFIINCIFQFRRDLRERELQQAQIAALDERKHE